MINEAGWFADHEEPAVTFNAEEITFEPEHPERLRRWIESVIAAEGQQLTFVSFIFCSDPYLHQLNVEYLEHDTLTDVITFPYSDPPLIEGDIFISIDRVRENAQALGVSFTDELHRIMVHGVLHLCGYSDKTPGQKEQMTKKEDEALALLS